MYALICRDDLTNGDTMDRSSVYVAGTFDAMVAALSDYPPEIARRLFVCEWTKTRGWIPAGSDE